ncbi:hypothetical protein [Vibrio phage vB_VmeM-Yong XC32]|nr:hypothetical protein [Vibrio phage vB_VmeM-Yong XC31]QAX96517.1 hypothetical protein [Vibrio phage vB_VmeM-Yong XC32]QAX96835.1 hypothetical protein [Vibrio phage vB_VmeM-Yong MS31]
MAGNKKRVKKQIKKAKKQGLEHIYIDFFIPQSMLLKVTEDGDKNACIYLDGFKWWYESHQVGKRDASKFLCHMVCHIDVAVARAKSLKKQGLVIDETFPSEDE